MIRIKNSQSWYQNHNRYHGTIPIIYISNDAFVIIFLDTYLSPVETELYYLQSRYYSPELCRFMSADDTSMLLATQGDLLGANLFAYCGNNPVMNSDPSGYKSNSNSFQSLLKGLSITRRYNGVKDCLIGIFSLLALILGGIAITTAGIDCIILGAGGTIAGICLAGMPWYVTVPLIIFGFCLYSYGIMYSATTLLQVSLAVKYTIMKKTFKIEAATGFMKWITSYVVKP